jgi:hypothetical protein
MPSDGFRATMKASGDGFPAFAGTTVKWLFEILNPQAWVTVDATTSIGD